MAGGLPEEMKPRMTRIFTDGAPHSPIAIHGSNRFLISHVEEKEPGGAPSVFLREIRG